MVQFSTPWIAEHVDREKLVSEPVVNIQHKQMADLDSALCCKAHNSSLSFLLMMSDEWWGCAQQPLSACIFTKTAWPFAVGAEIISSPPLPDHTRQTCLLQSCCAGIQLARALLRSEGRRQNISIQLFPLLLLRIDSAFLTALQENRGVWSGTLHCCAGLSLRWVFRRKCWVQQHVVNANLCVLLRSAHVHTPPFH